MANTDFSRLQNCACFNVRKTSRTITQLFDRALKPSGIKATQFTLLSVLANHSEVTISDLSTALGMDRTTLTRGIVRLEKEDLITSREGDDARQRIVEITPHGIQILTAAIPYWESAQNVMEKGLGDNFQSFLETLDISATIAAN